jgi:hypothetical protein
LWGTLENAYQDLDLAVMLVEKLHRPPLPPGPGPFPMALMAPTATGMTKSLAS